MDIRKFQVVIFSVLAFGVGYSLNNIAISDPTPRVAVIDTTKILTNSSSVKALKAEQEKQMKSMQATLEKAREEISKETDPKKAAALEEKYRNEINGKKIALDTNYNKRIKDLDTEIRATVVSKAKSMNYDLVLPKDVVFFGGDDITDIIAKEVK